MLNLEAVSFEIKPQHIGDSGVIFNDKNELTGSHFSLAVTAESHGDSAARMGIGGVVAGHPQASHRHHFADNASEDDHADANPEHPPLTNDHANGADEESQSDDDDGRPSSRGLSMIVMVARDGWLSHNGGPPGANLAENDNAHVS